jgi:hypothetical protein
MVSHATVLGQSRGKKGKSRGEEKARRYYTYRDAFGVECAKVGIFEDRCHVILDGNLQSINSRGLHLELVVDALCDLAH